MRFDNFIQNKMLGIPNLKYKTSICNSWKEGKFKIMKGLPCQKGFFCFFAHGEQELRTIEEHLAQQNKLLDSHSTSRYKTTYCKFYAKGEFKLGQSCTFAHGKFEKRQKNYIPKQQIITNPIYYHYPQPYPNFNNQIGMQMNSMYQYQPNFEYNWQTQYVVPTQISQKKQQKTTERQSQNSETIQKEQKQNSRSVQEFRQQ